MHSKKTQSKNNTPEPSDVFGYQEILKEIERKEQERKAAFRKNLPSYVWQVIKGLFLFFIVVAVFDATTYSENKLVVTVLVLIYLAVDGFASGYGYATAQITMALANELLAIKKLLKYEEGEEEKNKMRQAVLQYKKIETNHFIHGIFLFAIFLIALWSLISTLE